MLETNTLAVVSFVVSLFWLFGLASIVAVVLGALALSQIERTGGRQYGKGLAMEQSQKRSLSFQSNVLMYFQCTND